jgi:hypothetical protein
VKRVVQEDENGCAAACVATLVGISYRKALKRLQAKYTSEMQLREALLFYGIELGTRLSLTRKTYCDLPKQDGLFYAKIVTAGGADKWDHWMVWDGGSQSIIDPYHGHISSYRTRLTAFFPITRDRPLPYSK